jgi:crotonobetainyl-CoA:carnitine CoA-transferase CaiB-like acyl-CoA transferase
MAQAVDFVVESYKPGTLDERGIGYRVLHERSPRLVVTSITPFGQTGPYSGYRGSDLEATALSGFMSLVGAPGRAPLRDSLPQAPMWTGMYAASGSLVAHHYRQKTGKGQHVDVSMQASMLWALANAPAFYSLGKQNLYRAGTMIIGRSITGAKMHALYPCKDGHINFIIYGGEAGKRSNEAMVAWMAEEGMAPDWLLQKDWGRFNVATSTQEEIDQIERPFGAFLAKRTKAEFANEAVKREILGYPVNNARDIREDPQLAAREFWQTVEHEDLRDTLTYPGGFAKFSRYEHPTRRAPRIGEHNDQVYMDVFGLSPKDLAELKQSKVV